MFNGLIELVDFQKGVFLLNPVEIESIRPYAVGRDDVPSLVKITTRSGTDFIIESSLAAMKVLFGIWDTADVRAERQWHEAIEAGRQLAGGGSPDVGLSSR